MSGRAFVVPFRRAAPPSRSVGSSREEFFAGVALPTPAIACLAAILYYFGSYFGFRLTPVDTPISIFWPPNAILLAIFLLTPRRIWWALLLAVLPAHFLIQLRTGIPLMPALGWFAGNTGEALFGAVCIAYFWKEREPLFESVHGVATFLAFGVLLAPAVTSFLDAGSTALTQMGRGYWTLWMSRLTSNMIANITIVPVIVIPVASGFAWFHKAGRARYFEAALLLSCIAAASYLVFAKGSPDGHGAALICAPLPLLVWAAARFGVGGISISMLGLTLISAWEALRGQGIFTRSSLFERVMSVHVLVVLFAFPLMLVAAIVSERHRRTQILQDAHKSVIHAWEAERDRVARELHDDMVQQLSLIGDAADRMRTETESSASRRLSLDQLYDQISRLSRTALNLSHQLYPFDLDYMGLVAGLEKLCRDVSLISGVRVNCSSEGFRLRSSPTGSRWLFRLAQDGLETVVHGTDTTSVTVDLTAEKGNVLLRIVSDATKISRERREKLVLTGMQGQTLFPNASFKIEAQPLRGVVIEASLPIGRPAESPALHGSDA